MTENYLNVLEESLQKKLQIMAKIQEYSLSQQALFQSEDVELDKYDEYVDCKGELIEQLTALDNGFEALYQRVAEELEGGREKYTEQIKRLQALVTRVTEQSVTIQAQEARNKRLVESYFSKQRKEIKHNRVAAKAAYDYYKSMNNSNHVPPQFMDSKN